MPPIRALCVKCAGFKASAFIPCEHCGFAPQSDQELANSLGVSIHYLTEEKLKELSLSCKQEGKSIQLTPLWEAKLIKEIKKTGVRRMAGIKAPTKIKRGLWQWLAELGKPKMVKAEIFIYSSELNESFYDIVPMAEKRYFQFASEDGRIYAIENTVNGGVMEEMIVPKKVWEKAMGESKTVTKLVE